MLPLDLVWWMPGYTPMGVCPDFLSTAQEWPTFTCVCSVHVEQRNRTNIHPRSQNRTFNLCRSATPPAPFNLSGLGCTLVEHLYLSNGAGYLLTGQPASLPSSSSFVFVILLPTFLVPFLLLPLLSLGSSSFQFWSSRGSCLSATSSCHPFSCPHGGGHQSSEDFHTDYKECNNLLPWKFMHLWIRVPEAWSCPTA